MIECGIRTGKGLLFLQIQNDAEKFAVKVNCSHFRPDELTVNVNGRELIVAGHHEEKSDPYGRVERHFIRKFALPKDANAEGREKRFFKTNFNSISVRNFSS